MNVAVVNTGPGVTWPTAIASSSCGSVSQSAALTRDRRAGTRGARSRCRTAPTPIFRNARNSGQSPRRRDHGPRRLLTLAAVVRRRQPRRAYGDGESGGRQARAARSRRPRRRPTAPADEHRKPQALDRGAAETPHRLHDDRDHDRLDAVETRPPPRAARRSARTPSAITPTMTRRGQDEGTARDHEARPAPRA